MKAKLVSKQTPLGILHRPPAGESKGGEYLYYAQAKGGEFGQTAHATVYDGPDHRREGCWWMGTAAPHMYETLSASAYTHHRKPEFQQRQ